MFERHNTQICRKLAFREIRFHKIRSILTALVAILTAALFSFVLFLASSQREGYERQIRSYSDFLGDIQFNRLTVPQAKMLENQPGVQSAVWYQPVGRASDGGDAYDLAPYSQGYAETVEGVPDRGRLPEKEHEIAMEIHAAYALLGSTRVGEAFTLEWTPEGGRGPVKQEFTLTGTWESDMYSYVMWISDSLASQYKPAADTANVKANVTLWRADRIEDQAARLAGAIALRQPGGYAVNGVFEESNVKTIESQVTPVLYTIPLVLLCGFLMFFAIAGMNLELDVRFYGRMKALGMTPFQMRRVLYYWSGLLTLCSVPVGWIVGYGITLWVGRTFALTPSDAIGFAVIVRWQDLALSLLGTWLMVSAAVIYPAFRAGRLKPVKAVQYEGARPGKTREPHHNSLLRMAFDGMWRQKDRMLFAFASVIVAVMFACACVSQTISFDMKHLVEDRFPFDYVVKGDGQRYNVHYDPGDESLTPELYEELSGLVGADRISRIYYAESELRLSDDYYQKVMEYYDRNLEYYRSYLQYTGFEEAYEKLKTEHTMMVAVYGVEQEYLRALTDVSCVLSGSYDRKTFENGSWCYLSGINLNSGDTEAEDYFQPLPQPGEELTIDGVSCQVMGTAMHPPNSLFVKPQSALFLRCYISARQFAGLYPDRSPVQLCLTAPDGEYETVGQVLENAQETGGYNYFIVERQQYYDGGIASLWTLVGPGLILSVVLFIIALLGFANLLLHRTLDRNREFAVYRSLGMSRRELYKLLILENMLLLALTAFLIYPLSAVAAGPVKDAMIAGRAWLYTPRFSVLPAHILLLFLLILAVFIPAVCIGITERTGIADRLNMEE